ncbi:MAG: superoxide dismutase family protein [Cyclobacteriaceae bacterium]|nr:superoxide dismutase family protein [Cyclobacteriaceae bacterium]MCB0500830.1 superoxide dismutase family protein [Cyclobacteriaceae bacterium]MCO5272465.1 superoxide dismutase family protein [Cyclobacteriaceae bacterium]MCW5903358.1 superoxide dismutase family protein [Cyclobacteriaceae bacterium]
MKVQHLSILAICLMIVASCTPAKKEGAENPEGAQMEEQVQEDTAKEEPTAHATLNSASGSSVTGTATFRQVGEMTVRMSVEAHNLSPGEHALHLHQNGDCSAPDATSAGGHWNPGGMEHGQRGVGEFHAGDIINLTADADGNVSWSEDIVGWTIGGSDSTNILNKGVIIHDKQDDFVTQPTGAAGGRVACGVIMEGSM